MMEKYFGKDEQSSHAQRKKEQDRSKVVVDKKIVVEEVVLPIKDHVVSTLIEKTSPKKETKPTNDNYRVPRENEDKVESQRKGG